MTKDAFVGTWDGETPKSVSATCGWCGIAVEMDRISPAVEIHRPEFYFPGTPQTVDVGATYICPREKCHMPSLVFLDFYTDHGKTWAHQVIGQLPRGSAQKMDGLRDEIDELRREAWSDFFGGAFRSALVMARAAVQRGVRTLGGEGKSLYDEIDDLQAKSLITSELREWAHEVRVAAREAAHPDELGAVTEEEAKESLAFTDAFLEYAIALPARRAERRTVKRDVTPTEASRESSGPPRL